MSDFIKNKTLSVKGQLYTHNEVVFARCINANYMVLNETNEVLIKLIKKNKRTKNTIKLIQEELCWMEYHYEKA